MSQMSGPGIFIPNGNQTMPHYFSGTACRASATIVPYQAPGPYVYVTSATLYVNNVPVDTYQYVTGEPYPMSVSLAAMFDSTVFTHLSTVTVKAEYWDSRGVRRENSASTVSKNSVLMPAYPEPEFEAGRDLAASNFSFLHQVPLSGEWTPSTFVSSMNGSSSVFVVTHGTPSDFWCGKVWTDEQEIEHRTSVLPYGNDQNYAILGHPEWIKSCGVEPYRVTQMGTGYPPYNDTTAPPIALAFVASCGTGANQDFIRFCHPYMNGYGMWLEDQAWTGFYCSILVAEIEELSDLASKFFAEGDTVARVRVKLIQEKFTDRDEKEYLEESDMPIYGDDCTRLTSVYTGDNTPPQGWFRSL